MTGHLLHVGYPKTGSKFLQRWFAAHPDIAFAPWGIAGFRDSHEMMAAAGHARPAWHVTSHEALLTPLGRYRDLGAVDGRIPLPTRGDQRAACAMLAGLFPAAHVLIVTRGYETLLRSFYAELVLGGAGCAFEDFCGALLAQVEAEDDAFHFDAAIDAYAEAFGPDRLLVLPYERIRDAPQAFLGAIEASLGIRPLPFTPERVRPSPTAERLVTYRRMTRWVRALPGPGSIAARYVAALRTGRLDRVAATIERLGGGPGEGGHGVPARLLEALGDRAARLRDNPLYRDYARDYRL